MSCCEPSGYEENEINGNCPDCGTETVDGDAYERCHYSQCICKTCGWAPCDESC